MCFRPDREPAIRPKKFLRSIWIFASGGGAGESLRAVGLSFEASTVKVADIRQ
jgi:hypothetical protein